MTAHQDDLRAEVAKELDDEETLDAAERDRRAADFAHDLGAQGSEVTLAFVAETFRDLLGVAAVGVGDGFFDLDAVNEFLGRDLP